MTVSPVISIITPVWNGLPYIAECVASVLSQEFQNWEMLISDNGSTDGTRDYLDTLTDPRIRIYKQTQNLGIFGNLNFLMQQAKAEISQMLCHDDYFVGSRALNDLVAYWQSAPPELGVARFNHEDVVQCSLTAFQKKSMPATINSSETELMFYVFGGSLTGNLSNISLRTNLVLKYGAFREDLPFAGDFEFWSRMGRYVSIGIQNEPVVFVRLHPQSASYYQNRKGELVGQNAEVVSKLYQRLLRYHPKMQFALQLHGTINYDSLQRYMAIKLWLIKGNREYLRELDRVSDNAVFLLPRRWRWVLFFLTIGGRIGRVSTARHLINAYWQTKQQVQEQQILCNH